MDLSAVGVALGSDCANAWKDLEVGSPYMSGGPFSYYTSYINASARIISLEENFV